MENRNRFSGTLSLINRINQNIAATKFWAILIGILTKVTWLITIFWAIFMTGKAGYTTDYLKYYTVTFINWIHNKYPTGGDEIYKTIIDYIQPVEFLTRYVANDPDAIKEAEWIAKTTHDVILYSKISFMAVGVLGLGAWYLAHREFKSQTGDRFKRGSMIYTARQLTKELKKSLGKGIIWIGKILIPAPVENLSFFLVGKPQQGKTILINSILKTVQARGDRAVVWCAKPGDFVSTHGVFPRDYIFCPSDSRTVKWTLMNDVVSMADFETIAHTLCPDKQGDKGPWQSGAREIISGLLKYCWVTDRKLNSEIWQVFNKTAAEMHKMLSQTPGCGRAAGLLANPDSPTSFSFYISVLVAVKPLELLANCDGDFSVKKWLKDGKGSIYIISTSRLKKMLAPVHTLFLEMVCTNHLDMEQDRKRRIWYMLDELPNLNKISKLEELLNVGPSFGVSAVIGTQSLIQLDAVYEETGRRAIFNACNTTIIFCVKDNATAEELAEGLGKAEIEVSRQNYAVSANEAKDSVTAMSEIKDKAIVMPDELKNLRPKNLYVQVSGFGCSKTVVKYIPYDMKNPAYVSDPAYAIERIEMEYAELISKATDAISTSHEKLETDVVQNSAQAEVTIDKNDLRWAAAQVLTDEDDGQAGMML